MTGFKGNKLAHPFFALSSDVFAAIQKVLLRKQINIKDNGKAEGNHSYDMMLWRESHKGAASFASGRQSRLLDRQTRGTRTRKKFKRRASLVTFQMPTKISI